MRAVREFAVPIKTACAVFGVSETCYRYRAQAFVAERRHR